MTAFATLVTSSMILITNIIGYIYDIIAKEHKNQRDGFKIIDSSKDGFEITDSSEDILVF